MAGRVIIVATGARTPVGLRAPAIAAAVRAGISRLAEHPFMVDSEGDPMPGALDRRLDPAMNGPPRFLALAESALREACAQLGDLGVPRIRMPIYLGLPEIRPGFKEQDAEAIRSGILSLKDLPAEFSEVTIFADGNAAGLSALKTAVDQIQSDAYEACLVGGVESYFHPDTMEWLDANRQLANTVSRSGFVPGEGAGFCLLMSEQAAEQLRMPSLGCVAAVATGRETKLIKTSDICLGHGLTATVQEAVSNLSLPFERVNNIICDINSERYRCEEWGFVCLRAGQYFDDPTLYQSPADCWGDMGAASGPLFAVLACESAARGYANGFQTLLWASSEGGTRAAALLTFEASAMCARRSVRV